MQETPQPVTDVSIFPYPPEAPGVVPPVFVNGAGSYAVGTLATNRFYNLDLTSGTPERGGVAAGTKYIAQGRGPDGKPFATPWMTCLEAGERPRFGRTATLGN